MLHAMRFLPPLLLVLGGLTWGASTIIGNQSRDWFEKDLVLRARLAVSGAREALAQHWQVGDSDRVRRVLEDITRDERILASAACTSEGALMASTSAYPLDFPCARLVANARAADGSWRFGQELTTTASGPVHVSTVPLEDGGRTLGHVVLVHDLSFAAHREVVARRLSLVAFGALAVVAALFSVLLAWRNRRSWLGELRAFLRGGAPARDFQPLVGDVRDLVQRMASEAEAGGGAWGPERLRATLTRHLSGESLVVVANREPYIHERNPDGSVRVLHPASGLVTALEPVMRACSGVWVAHGAGSADRETADRKGHVRVPPDDPSYLLRRVWLGPAEEQGYYYGFANEGLWPLHHVAHQRPVFRQQDFVCYQAVNQKFARAVCEELASPDPIILVQDYHFGLLPRMLRERVPGATILAFWHIPWPNSERFGICPKRIELLEGMLGSSIVGFHTQLHCNNFLETVDRFLEARIDREQQAVVHRGRTTFVRPYPISIEWPSRWASAAPPVDECRRSVLAELGLRPDALLGVGVDRLDYTKGIEERLLAVERTLERFPQLIGRFTFVQLAAPSRTRIERYAALNVAVEGLAERINARWQRGAYRPIVLLRAHHEPETVFRFYRAADVCYVSSLHDGMNLVAKEFVAAREDERGVLVLSHFTGAARELTEALIVNPYDLEEASVALARALSMPADEQRDRMRAMRSLVGELNVYRWAGRMLVDAARLRHRDRLTGRLAEPLRPASGADR